MPDSGRNPGEGIPPLLSSVRRVLVVGCGASGEAVASRLLRDGVSVTVSDRRNLPALGPAADRLRRRGAELETGGHAMETFLRHDLIVVSPGVPPDVPALLEARRRGVRVISEVEFASLFLQGEVVGITGTNGKSTTTSLLGSILSSAGKPVTVCGNIGTPLTTALERDGPGVVHCVELSSFQLEGIQTFRPRIAILLNLRPDHQDRYRNHSEYAAAKARIFAHQGPSDHALLNGGDPACVRLGNGLRSRVHLFASRGTPPEGGAGLVGGRIQVRLEGKSQTILLREEIPLPGVHNLENVLSCALAARILGIAPEAIRRAVRGFHGLPHRMEKVAEIDGVTFWNDSKATNVDAVLRCLESFSGRVVLILGGKDKGGDFRPLREAIRSKARRLILIGEARPTLHDQVGDLVPTVQVRGLGEAVAEARRSMGSGDTVLLSPGCASFDAYGSFEERGEHFRQLVVGPGRGATP